MNNPETLHRGGCLCGGVRYEVRGPLRTVTACHCSQCRRTSGHYAAMTEAPWPALRMMRADTLAWYASSTSAERGFCRVCGGNLFWRPAGKDTVSITAGTLDLPTGLAMGEHIFVDDKGDYYGIEDGLPKKAQWT
jgi:hypothetical protein